MIPLLAAESGPVFGAALESVGLAELADCPPQELKISAHAKIETATIFFIKGVSGIQSN
jgi:hypothetical protein